jgi:hypothetical protein
MTIRKRGTMKPKQTKIALCRWNQSADSSPRIPGKGWRGGVRLCES